MVIVSFFGYLYRSSIYFKLESMANEYTVLVPMDFSEVADTAVNHAAMIAESFKGEVHLLHVVNSDKGIDPAKEKLEQKCAESQERYQVPFSCSVKRGTIFEEIGKVADEIGAMLVIMGTHGLKGIQHLTGSYALRVIANSKVPFIVVQNKKSKGSIRNILLPIQISDETKSKLPITSSIARHFGATIHIFLSKENDDFLRNKINRELIFARNYFDERKISYEVKFAEESGNYLKQMLKYGNSMNVDMIAVVNSSGDINILPEIFKGEGEQDVITNKYGIPAIIMNPNQIFVPEHFG